jgi:hypothetical protein
MNGYCMAGGVAPPPYRFVHASASSVSASMPK